MIDSKLRMRKELRDKKVLEDNQKLQQTEEFNQAENIRKQTHRHVDKESIQEQLKTTELKKEIILI